MPLEVLLYKIVHNDLHGGMVKSTDLHGHICFSWLSNTFFYSHYDFETIHSILPVIILHYKISWLSIYNTEIIYSACRVKKTQKAFANMVKKI